MPTVLRPFHFCTPENLEELLAWRKQWIGDSRRDDAAENSLRFVLSHLRVGIYCALRKDTDGVALVFQPCANGRFRNTMRLPSDSFRVCTRAQKFWPAHRQHPIRPDVESWSLNGTLLDNWEAESPWTESNNSAFQSLLLAASLHVPEGTYEFLLNRRDSPQIPVLLPRLVEGPWRRADNQLQLLPCLSQYTHDAFMDRPIPPITAWVPSDVPYIAWRDKRPLAVFRGSATTCRIPADNHRVRAVRALRNHPLADARLTSASYRYRYIRGRLVLPDTALPRSLLGRRMTYAEQARYKWSLYIEGNAGADRVASILTTGSLLIAVESDAPSVAWFRNGTLLSDVHYLRARRPEDLPALLEWCLAHDDTCARIAEAGYQAYRRAMRPHRVAEAVAAALVYPDPPPQRVRLMREARHKRKVIPRGK